MEIKYHETKNSTTGLQTFQSIDWVQVSSSPARHYRVRSPKLQRSTQDPTTKTPYRNIHRLTIDWHPGRDRRTRKQGIFAVTASCAPRIAWRNALDHPTRFVLSLRSQNVWQAGHDQPRDRTSGRKKYVDLRLPRIGTTSFDMFIGLHVSNLWGGPERNYAAFDVGSKFVWCKCL